MQLLGYSMIAMNGRIATINGRSAAKSEHELLLLAFNCKQIDIVVSSTSWWRCGKNTGRYLHGKLQCHMHDKSGEVGFIDNACEKMCWKGTLWDWVWSTSKTCKPHIVPTFQDLSAIEIVGKNRNYGELTHLRMTTKSYLHILNTTVDTSIAWLWSGPTLCQKKLEEWLWTM